MTTETTYPSATEFYDEAMAFITGGAIIATPIVIAAPVLAVVAVASALVLGAVAVALGAVAGVPLLVGWAVRAGARGRRRGRRRPRSPTGSWWTA